MYICCMDENTIKRIEKSGYKKKYIAEKIGVLPSMLSMSISGDRDLLPEKELKLKALLKHVEL